MPLKTEEVYRIGSQKHEKIHILSCSECDASFRLDDEEAEYFAAFDMDLWVCEDCNVNTLQQAE